MTANNFPFSSIDVADSLRRIISNWIRTSEPLTQEVSQNDTIIKIRRTNRFLEGEEVALINKNANSGEPNFKIKKIIDGTTVELDRGVQLPPFGPSNNSFLSKTWGGNFIKYIYLGDPSVIAQYPAVAVMNGTTDSEWLTLGITQERYNASIMVYVESDNTESSYRLAVSLADTIIKGLKSNIFPLVGPFDVVPITANVQSGDLFIKVDNTNNFTIEQKIVIEDIFKSEEMEIEKIVDATTIKVIVPPISDYDINDSSKIIGLNRFIYRSWPRSRDPGFIHKGSAFLHAVKIDWYGDEAEAQIIGGWGDPSTT